MEKRLIESAEELRELTGTYDANNDFDKIETFIEQATEELAQTVGREVIDLALAQPDAPADERDELLRRKVQRPVALLATLRLCQHNDLSHEDDGRKFKTATDGSERLPWEWQLERDDRLQLEAYWRSVDALISYLNLRRPEAWTQGTTYRTMQTLLLRSGRQFSLYYPIEGSERMYLLLVPFIREAQVMTVAPAYGEGWAQLMAEDELPESDAHYAACMAVALLAVGKALQRLPLGLVPGGVVRRYLNENGMRGSEAATPDEVRRVTEWMVADAARWVERMKRARDGSKGEWPVLPKNDRHNKFMTL